MPVVSLTHQRARAETGVSWNPRSLRARDHWATYGHQSCLVCESLGLARVFARDGDSLAQNERL